MAGADRDPFDFYLYQVSGGGPARRREPASRQALRRERERAARRFRKRAREFLQQAGHLRRLAAHLSTPEQLISPMAFRFFAALVPRLHSVFQIAESFRESLRRGRIPAGATGLDFLLRVAKTLVRQIEAALAVAELESGRSRRRAVRFDLQRLLAEAFRQSQLHYLGNGVGVTVHRRPPLHVRGVRCFWQLALVDLICRAHETSPRRGVAARTEEGDEAVVVKLLPRGALVPQGELPLRRDRQRLLGRTERAGSDPSFLVTRRLVELLGGRLSVGRVQRSFITPLFTVEVPIRGAAPRGPA